MLSETPPALHKASRAPADAFFTEEQIVSTDGSRVTVGEELVLEGGVLRDAGGDRLEMDRPLQLFSRWYGFALAFPGTTIYGWFDEELFVIFDTHGNTGRNPIC